ncbi:MAG: Thiamin biosynthesis lipoprotein ApbE [uncultured Thiotrichaceae bacterium]|uniref:FAD:protein FMN transferase n=1 Tax=uncultured Thiotrichaceae bacterium TaxID=298394 RepID=A0A6S6T7P7_9GAMM|nr:MAG: Thiamin biosynthesis lipoprotein ApbE [uncultured Thiotrichaceae bacterium]
MPAYVLAFLCLLILNGCSETEPEAIKLQGQTMGTTWSAVILLPKNSETAFPDNTALQAGLDNVLKTVNDQMSTWQQDSELSTFNRYEQTDWFPVSGQLAKVTQAALAVSRFSEGQYDVTVGPLVNLWGFGAAKKATPLTVPEQSAIDEILLNVGYTKLAVRLDPPALKKQMRGVYVDLSSIAKGYGVDQLAAYLNQLGVTDYMLEIGGEIHVKGQSPRGDNWRIAVEKPVDLGSSIQQGLNLKAGGLATSGDYRNFFSAGGKRYSHTLNPATGYPIKHSLASVSVMAENTMLADAYATMLMAMGEVKGKAFAVEKGLDAYFIRRTDDGFETFATDGFKQALIQ